MRYFSIFFNCGKIHKTNDVFEFKVTRFQDITEIIAPFFKQYNVKGFKAKQFSQFIEVLELMKNKEHLTPNGIRKIRKMIAEI